MPSLDSRKRICKLVTAYILDDCVDVVHRTIGVQTYGSCLLVSEQDRTSLCGSILLVYYVQLVQHSRISVRTIAVI